MAADPRSEDEAVEELPRHYSNAMRAQATPFDIAIDFGYRRGEETPAYEVRIAMSWQHLQLMVKSLQELVDGYQRNVGPLPDLQRVPAVEVVEEEEGER